MKLKNNRLKRIIMSEAFDKVLWALVVGMLFVIAGNSIQKNLVIKSDPEEYYYLKSPVMVEDRTFYPGEKMTLTTERESSINIGAMANRELSLITLDNVIVEVYQDQVPLVIDRGSRDVSFVIRLPEDLLAGCYRWSGAVSFDIQGNEKVVYWESEIFEVKTAD